MKKRYPKPTQAVLALWGGLFFALLSVLPAAALEEIEPEPLMFDHITRREGLSYNSVSAILQDEHGFLWFATQSGLNRYDGKKIEVYKNEPYNPNSLPHNLIQTMTLGRENILWIGTYHGLSRFDPSQGTFRNYDQDYNDGDSLSNDVVVSIAERRDGKIWVGTLKGLNLFDPESERFGKFFHDDDDPMSLSSNVIRDVMEDSRGTTWVGGYAGLDRYNPDSGSFTHYRPEADEPSSLLSPYVMKILETRPGELWLGCWGTDDGQWQGGIVRFDLDSGEMERHPLPDHRVYDLVQAGDGTFWVATWGGGLIHYDPESRKAMVYEKDDEDPFSLSHNTVYSLAYDNAGLLWVGTNGKGVNKMNPNKESRAFLASRSDTPNSLPSGKINAILEDTQGRIWVGVYNGGVSRYDPETGRLVNYRADVSRDDTISNDIVNDLYQDSKGRIWVPTNGGLNRYNPGSDSFMTFPSDTENPENPEALSDSIIYEIMEDDQGRFWVGTYNNGIDLFSPQWKKIAHFEHISGDETSLSDNLVYDIEQREDGTVWIGTNKGLNRFISPQEGFRRYLLNPADSGTLSSNTVWDIYEDSRRRLWLATMGGGLNRYYDETDDFDHFTEEDGLSSDEVVSVLEDKRGRIWVATQFGLSILYPETRTFTNLQEEDGLLGVEFNTGSTRLANGDLLFGTVDGINRFSGDDDLKRTQAPSVVITDLSLMNEEQNWYPPIYERSEINLTYQNTVISFEFAALDYSAPKKNQFAYMLEGVDREWVFSGTRGFANYTNLRPGGYTFRVKAANSDGVWSQEEAQLKIRVAAPPWRTPAAYLIYLFLIGGVIYLLIQWKAGSMLKGKVQELEETRNKLEEANRKLSILSIQDPLTGINNRRRLDDLLRVDWKQSERSRIPLAALMIDIDFFKRYNDFHGHQQGDECLQRVSRILSENLERGSDYAARYGGEEFCVILHDTDNESACLVADKLRRSVEEAGIPHGNSSVSEVVTISIGVASWIPREGESMEVLIAEADRSLYRAKAHGRNRVESTPFGKS